MTEQGGSLQKTLTQCPSCRRRAGGTQGDTVKPTLHLLPSHSTHLPYIHFFISFLSSKSEQRSFNSPVTTFCISKALTTHCVASTHIT